MESDAEKFERFCESDFGKEVLEKESDYIRRELKDCGRILDVGCGIGSFERQLQDLNIVGLDSSAEMLEEARKSSDKEFVLGDAEKLEFGDGSFDAVFFVTALEFLSDYRQAIREAWRVTKPGGKLLVMMLNPESEYFHKHMRKKESYFHKIRHADMADIKNFVAGLYRAVRDEYFLGIRDQRVFDTTDRKLASLYVLVGIK